MEVCVGELQGYEIRGDEKSRMYKIGKTETDIRNRHSVYISLLTFD